MAKLPSTRVTPETLFYTASTTKAFTAAALSILIDESTSPKSTSAPLAWTTPLADIIRDDFVLTDEYATGHVSFEDALSHRSGMPRHDLTYGGKTNTVKDIVRSFRHLPMTGEIRTKYQYCNIMYCAVSHALETITGQWFGDVLKSKLWHPLGMNSTFLSYSDAQAAQERGGSPLAMGYIWDEKDRSFKQQDYIKGYELSGAGGVISNVRDYAMWLRMMMKGAAPVSEKGHAALITPRSFVPLEGDIPFTGPETYALGWRLKIYRGQKIIMHTGDVTGFGSFVLYLPGRNWGVVMFGNAVAAYDMETKLAFHLIDELLQTPIPERFDWDESFEDTKIKHDRENKDSRHRLYPNIDENVPSLPLQSYTGTYSHPAYQSLALDISNDVLLADVKDRAWPHVITFVRFSGDHFLAEIRRGPPPDNTSHAARARFHVGADGKVVELGIGMEPSMGADLIWYKRAT